MSESVVIDASAAVALLKRERGWEQVPQYLANGFMSAVNFAEVVQVLHRSAIDPDALLPTLIATGLKIVEADAVSARAAGDLQRMIVSGGLSLADRFCLSLAIASKLPVLTADRPWQKLNLPITLKYIR